MSRLLQPTCFRFLSVCHLRTTAPRLLNGKHLAVSSFHHGNTLSAGLSFEDASAFRVKSLRELMRALGVFRFCSFPVLVNNSGKLLSIARFLLGKRIFSLILRPTVYAQFVAGETERDIAVAVEKMSSLGIRPMLAVPIEEDLGESTGESRYDSNLEAMMECVRLASSTAMTSDPMMQLKVTALLSPELCVKLTSLLQNESYELDLVVRAMDGEHISFPGLTESENTHFLYSLKRLNKVGEASVKKVRVLVDAEYTYMNPALSLVTMAMMKKFNREDAWIWNTYQCYLKESRSLLLDAVDQSVKQSFCFGVKLVRGAYMDKERKLANQEGRLDPIHQSWEHTNDSYNGSLDVMLDLISQHPGRYRLIIATHNEVSVKHAVSRMAELGIQKQGGPVCFGQLLGMCDHVSLTLAQQGYSIYKSMPYGSVDDTVPYLVRRAQENRAVLQGIRKERDLLRQELRRRLKAGITGGR